MRVERVHGVVLGRGEHASVEDERLGVYRGVERALPRLVRRKELRLGGVVTGSLRVPVIHGPTRTGEGGHRARGERGCKRGDEN